MRNVTSILARTAIMAAAVSLGLFWSGQLPLNKSSSFVSAAEARIGRPLTPLSYAGVARRTTRRAVAVGAAAVVVAPVVVAPAAVCGQVVDVYGRIVTVCR